MQAPRAADRIPSFQNGERRARPERLQVIGRADPRNPAPTIKTSNSEVFVVVMGILLDGSGNSKSTCDRL
jgi:hypothetical protein